MNNVIVLRDHARAEIARTRKVSNDPALPENMRRLLKLILKDSDDGMKALAR